MSNGIKLLSMTDDVFRLALLSLATTTIELGRMPEAGAVEGFIQYLIMSRNVEVLSNSDSSKEDLQ